MTMLLRILDEECVRQLNIRKDGREWTEFDEGYFQALMDLRTDIESVNSK